MSINFSGNKDTDYEILYNLSDYDLGNVCKINRYTREICRNDIFWMNRTLRRFIPIFGTFENLKSYKEQHAKTWRDYYISLIDSIETNKARREDLDIIEKFILDKTKKQKEYFLNDPNHSLKWLNEDFIDLKSMFLEILEGGRFKRREKINILLKFFQIEKFNVNNTDNDEVKKDFLFYILANSEFDFLKKSFPYIKNHKLFLDVLFQAISEGFILKSEMIVAFLENAIEKGATKYEIEKYYKLNRFDPPDQEMYTEKINYEKNMKTVKKYLKLK